MTEREMLEYAAKAAAYSYRVETCGDSYQVLVNGGLWNPRDDDGDALRLSAELQISVLYQVSGVKARNYRGKYFIARESTSYEDAEATKRAVRLAITRAAAEIGKAMP